MVEVTDPNSKIYGAKISTAAGALSEHIVITITEGHAGNDPNLLGIPILCQPDGVWFDEEVEITMPLEEPTASDQSLALMVFNELLEKYEFASRLVKVQSGASEVTVTIDHFSSFRYMPLSTLISTLKTVSELAPILWNLKGALETGNCSEIDSIRAELLGIQDDHYNIMLDFSDAYELCKTLPGCDLSDWLTNLENYVKGKILKVGATYYAELFGGIAAGTVVQAGLNLYGIIKYGLCDLCYITNSWLNLVFWESFWAYHVCEYAIQIIDFNYASMCECHKLDPNCDGCIDTEELMVAIGMWKNGEITISELMEAIGIWKGCTSNLNVALQQNGGTATADSWVTYLWYTGRPSNAIDGVTDSGAYPDAHGWRGSNIPGWLEVEFDQIYEIENISIWFGSHQQTYSISLSPDGTSWTEVVAPRLSENTEGFESVVPETFSIVPTLAKFIRVDITTTSAPSAHLFKSSINELEVYASPGP